MTNDIAQRYSTEAGIAHRQSFGQYFTPEEVATFMCRWTMETKAKNLLDPAFGLGVFYLAAKKLNSNIAFSSWEIDKKIFDFYRSNSIAKDSQLGISNEDYLHTWGIRAEAVVCNPPYQRFQHFENRSLVFKVFEKKLGVRLAGYTNIASAFLLKSIHELSPGGRLAYIMPIEFLNTGYGGLVKEALLKDGLLKELIRIEAEKDVFPEATTTVVIVLAARDGIADPVKFSTIDSLSELTSHGAIRSSHCVSRSTLNPKSKWLPYFEKRQLASRKEWLVPLSYYGSFSRGIATGANEFFSLSKSDIERHELPNNNVQFCITKSAQINTPVFTQDDLLSLSDRNIPVHVLDIHGKPTKSVQAYIASGEEQGFDQRYLTKCRNPWYKLEHRLPSPLLMGVFSRNGHKIIRNFSTAIHLTCYHGFYPNMFGKEYVDSLFFFFLSQAGERLLKINMRRYGDKLDKFEPNDLNATLVPSPEFFDRIDPSLLSITFQNIRNNKSIGKLEGIFGELICDSNNSKIAS